MIDEQANAGAVHHFVCPERQGFADEIGRVLAQRVVEVPDIRVSPSTTSSGYRHTYTES